MSELALLILVGGRQTPNFYTAQFLQPDVIVPIASHEAINEKFPFSWAKTEPVIKQNCKKTTIAEPKIVDAFNLAGIKEKCLEAINNTKYANYEWVFNVTCATTVMSIAAYEIAKEKGFDCWYLATNNNHVETLTGKPPEGELYRISIENYVKLSGRDLVNTAPFIPTKGIENFVRKLANNLELANAFGKSAGDSKSANSDGQRVLKPENEIVKSLWYEAKDLGLVSETGATHLKC